eukprot:CAMPEP_0182479756 /NCGR_PEP_ID=MMETSP1319-20130603/34709_1 /TAXON_ID=172717 /ORGANISM="Bolidomonas pacifica, Strain RCC208" /LENGTH=61 /DNA_ID=CAMNT_0024681195 /DNA_START=37 /DNA_END=218 /DNA_ORIENTATION=-
MAPSASLLAAVLVLEVLVQVAFALAVLSSLRTTCLPGKVDEILPKRRRPPIHHLHTAVQAR